MYMTKDIIIRRMTPEEIAERNKPARPQIGQQLGDFLAASGASKHRKAMKKKSEKAKQKEYNDNLDKIKEEEAPKPTLTLSEELKALSSTIRTPVDDFTSPEYIPLTHELISHTIQGGDYDEEGNPIMDDVIKKQSRTYKKDDEDPFESMFSEEKLLLWNVIKDQSEYVTDLNQRIKARNEMNRGKSSIGAMNKTDVDLMISLDSSRNTLLSAIKQSTDLKKVQADLKLKKAAQDAKAKENNAGEENHEMLISSLIQGLAGNGGRELAMGMGAIHPGNGLPAYDPIEEIMKLDPQYADGSRPVGEVTQYAEYQDMMGDILDRRTEGYRDESLTKRIMYENKGVEVCIASDPSTGEWDFFARDKEGNMIMDYPLPSKEEVGHVEFMETSATDSRGIIYPLVEDIS